jgi:hypothetical protein
MVETTDCPLEAPVIRICHSVVSTIDHLKLLPTKKGSSYVTETGVVALELPKQGQHAITSLLGHYSAQFNFGRGAFQKMLL